jgi:hypothetical protein
MDQAREYLKRATRCVRLAEAANDQDSWLLWLAPWLELRPKPGSLLYPIEASCDLARGSYFFARRFLRVFLVRLPADLSTKKSSRLAPTLIAAVNHLG